MERWIEHKKDIDNILNTITQIVRDGNKLTQPSKTYIAS